MRVQKRTPLMAGLVMSVALTGAGGSAVAYDADCARALWAVPIETLQLPAGWTWSSISPFQLGGWTASIEVPDASDPEYPFRVRLQFYCGTEPRSYLDAEERVNGLGIDRRSTGVTAIGDQVVAYTYIGEYATDNVVDWANGTVLASITAEQEVDWNAVQDFALAIDAMLP